MGHIFLLKVFIYMKFRFNWTASMLFLLLARQGPTLKPTLALMELITQSRLALNSCPSCPCL